MMTIVRFAVASPMAVLMLAGLMLSFTAETAGAGAKRDHRGSTTKLMPAPSTGFNRPSPGYGAPGRGRGFDSLNSRHRIPSTGVTVRDHR